MSLSNDDRDIMRTRFGTVDHGVNSCRDCVVQCLDALDAKDKRIVELEARLVPRDSEGRLTSYGYPSRND